MHIFAERLREILEVNKMTQIQLAKNINMSQVVVNDYCSGRRLPSLKVLVLICKALDESADYLLGLTD